MTGDLALRRVATMFFGGLAIDVREAEAPWSDCEVHVQRLRTWNEKELRVAKRGIQVERQRRAQPLPDHLRKVHTPSVDALHTSVVQRLEYPPYNH